MNRKRTIGALAALVLILAACGPAASGGSAEPSSQASIAESSAPQASDGGSEPAFSEGVVADLEALIPDTVGDVTMQKSSMRGSEFLVTDSSDPAMIKFVQDLGVSPSDVSMALGFGFSAEPASNVVMVVFRAEGADSGRLVSAFKESVDAERETPLAWSTTNFGGKQVEAALDGVQTIYLYSKGDLLVYITASDTALSEEVISGLP